MRMATRRLLVLVWYAACAACAVPANDPGLLERSAPSVGTIYLVSHGWHAGLVIRRADIPDDVWPEHRDFPGAEYLEVGWGDSDFYQTPDPRLGTALKASLTPTESVLHVVGFNGPVAAYFPSSEIIEIAVDGPGLVRLFGYIRASYFEDPAGHTISLGRGLYGDSRFYKSHETYHLFNNCNAWTARALQAGGCPIESASILRVETLLARARSCGTVIRSRPKESAGHP